MSLGGLAAPQDGAVQRIATHCLKLWSGAETVGHSHAQSKRFLDPTWGSEDDPPLRDLVVALSEGRKSVSDFIDGNTREEQSFVKWVSAFRLAALPFIVFFCDLFHSNNSLKEGLKVYALLFALSSS